MWFTAVYRLTVAETGAWTQLFYVFSVKDVIDDCEIMTDANCHQGAWHKYSHHRRKRDSNDVNIEREPRHGNKQLCVNVRCIQVMRVMAKFGAKPQAFPYDIQFPYLEFKSRAYPLSLLQA